jgi:thioredoxin reductase (NADPH)
METFYTIAIFALLLLIIAVPYWYKAFRHQKQAARTQEKSAKADLLVPTTLHPRIDVLACIGCGSCVRACPEDALGLVGGRAAIVNGTRCVGHGVCLDVCPVGAITLGFGPPKLGMEIPLYDDNYETNIAGLYIVGELGGIGLIKNAFEQGMHAVEHIARRKPTPENGVFDVAIVGAGPAGIGAALAAQAAGLRSIVLEQYDLGGSVLHYPRKKIILTSPVDLPLFGRLKVSEISKEELLDLFLSLVSQFKLNVRTQEKVETITSEGTTFKIVAGANTYRASRVLLATGRRGSPRKLNVPGEQLTKVYYRLFDAESYTGKRLLVVGGGDSAIEAAVALARQRGNEVTISYRRDAFVRLKEKNDVQIRELMKRGESRVLFNSEVMEIQEETVLVREGEKIIHTIKNDAVFIFAGGELPAEFLKKIGVELRTAELEAMVA